MLALTIGRCEASGLENAPSGRLHPLYREILHEGKRTQREMWLVDACGMVRLQGGSTGSTRDLMPVLVVPIGEVLLSVRAHIRQAEIDGNSSTICDNPN